MNPPPRLSLPSEEREAQLLWGVRWLTARATLRQLLTEARLRTGLVVGLSLFFWGGLFILFYQGFKFLVDYVGNAGAPYHAETVRFVFHLFFASLNVMLVFSSGIILYGGLYASAETRFLMTQPIRAERIVLHKFQEAVLFSSWGVFLLASPLAVAYGVVTAAPWHYFVLIGPLVLSFVYILCAVGATVCMLLLHRLPQLRLTVVAAAAAVSVGFAAKAVWESVRSPQTQMFGEQWFRETLRRFGFTQQQWLPSSWLSNGLMEAALPAPAGPLRDPTELPVIQSCLYLALLISNALVCHLMVIAAGRRWFRPGVSNLECRVRKPRRQGLALVDRLATWVLTPLAPQVRLLLLKDWRLLRRDPAQWSQFLIFFGLLGLYFLNVDRFSNPGSELSYVTWVNMVSFLNLAVVGLILSTFTTRFIYPMISLEGRRFWVLGLMPIDRWTIIWSKFLFAAIGSWGPCALLVLLSDLMLRVAPVVVLVHQVTTVLLCVGLAAMAVGLGATMPDFRETSPSKIAAGFGGTLNLVLSAGYILTIVALTALPCHFYLIAEGSIVPDAMLNSRWLKAWLIAGTGLAILTGALATAVPLARGYRAFRNIEFN